MLDKLQTIWHDFIHVIYPDLCLACESKPKASPSLFCSDCLFYLPLTDHFTQSNNTVTKHFHGRVDIVHGAALYYMTDDSHIHNVIHKLKYGERTEIGIDLGELIGKQIKESSLFPPINLIIPVPLTKRKKYERGYNQCAFIAQGVSNILDTYYSDNIVRKIRETPTQTGLNRYDRVQNVANVFEISNPNKIKNQHVLIVDDVVTTGATIESLSNVILAAGASSVSIATIGAAQS
jgi:ComF family protein